MARSQNSFNKKERENKKRKKKKDKLERKEERKANSSGGGLEDMMAYIDEDGNITDTPPEKTKKSTIKASDIEISVPKKEKEDLTLERRGKVSFFNDSKGYGFIEQDGTQERFFVHVNNVEGSLEEGTKVSFSLEPGAKGLDAVNVKIVR